MKKGTFMVMVVMAMLTLTSALAFAHDTTIKLAEQNGSGQNGTAILTDMEDGTTKVVIEVSNGTDEPQPAHIHPGSCANLDPKPIYPLNNVVNGRSETIVAAEVHDLTDGAYAINLHKSATEASTYTSCGDIVAEHHEDGGVVGMPTTGNGGQDIMAGALALLALALTGAGFKLARRQA